MRDPPTPTGKGTNRQVARPRVWNRYQADLLGREGLQACGPGLSRIVGEEGSAGGQWGTLTQPFPGAACKRPLALQSSKTIRKGVQLISEQTGVGKYGLATDSNALSLLQGAVRGEDED